MKPFLFNLIGDFKYVICLGEFDISPQIQTECLSLLPERSFKDGCRVKLLDLKGLWNRGQIRLNLCKYIYIFPGNKNNSCDLH